MGLDRGVRQRSPVGHRGYARELRKRGPAPPRRWRTCGAAELPLQLGDSNSMDGRLRGCRLAHRGDRQRGGGDREPPGALRLAEAPGTAREGSRGRCTDSERDRAGRARRARDGVGLGALGGRRPVQRPRPLRGGGIRGPASHLRPPQLVVHVGAARAGRGGRARRRGRARP